MDIRVWAYSEASNSLTERFKIPIVNTYQILFFLLP
jgi:hypothetical protein